MSGNSHQRRLARRSGKLKAERASADFDAFNRWCRANRDRIAAAIGADCPSCKLGNVRRDITALLIGKPSAPRCDTCGWAPDGSKPDYSGIEVPE